jgi:hypothetical protein
MSTICGVGIDVSARELTVSIAGKAAQSFENNAKGHRAISRLVTDCAKGISPGLCRGDGKLQSGPVFSSAGLWFEGDGGEPKSGREFR